MLKLEHVSKVYRAADVETAALDDLSLEVPQGEFLAIMGPSGCGKSTLLNILGLIDSPTAGNYWFMGEDIAKCSEEELTLRRRAGVGFVFRTSTSSTTSPSRRTSKWRSSTGACRGRSGANAYPPSPPPCRYRSAARGTVEVDREPRCAGQ